MGFKETNELGMKLSIDGLAPQDPKKDGYLHNWVRESTGFLYSPNWPALLTVKKT